jgi:hypothetical protein
MLCQPKEKCKDFVAHPVSVNESTAVGDIMQFTVFIRDVNKDFQIVEKLLKVVPMKGKAGVERAFLLNL